MSARSAAVQFRRSMCMRHLQAANELKKLLSQKLLRMLSHNNDGCQACFSHKELLWEQTVCSIDACQKTARASVTMMAAHPDLTDVTAG